jgi:hypothetical protein
MKSLTKFFLTCLLIAGVTATYADVQDRHLSGYSAIQISGSFDVYVKQGAGESVKVDASNDVQDRIITEVTNGVLKIYNKHNVNWGDWWSNSKRIVIYVSIKDINSLNASGSGDIFFKEGISAGTFKLGVSGSGNVTGKLSVKTLDARISGSSDIQLNGRADNCTVSISGSGDFSAPQLITQNTTVHVSGSGDAKVNASQTLEASVSGSGDIGYLGNPKVSSSKSGSGEVHKI